MYQLGFKQGRVHINAYFPIVFETELDIRQELLCAFVRTKHGKISIIVFSMCFLLTFNVLERKIPT